MSKGFKSTTALDSFDDTTTQTTNNSVSAENKIKRKPGRPRTKTEETKTINIAVPLSALQKLEDVKVCYNNNLTLYINTLIEKDLEANYETYMNVVNSLNNFK